MSERFLPLLDGESIPIQESLVTLHSPLVTFQFLIAIQLIKVIAEMRRNRAAAKPDGGRWALEFGYTINFVGRGRSGR
jgi:hypothetical protein